MGCEWFHSTPFASSSVRNGFSRSGLGGGASRPRLEYMGPVSGDLDVIAVMLYALHRTDARCKVLLDWMLVRRFSNDLFVIAVEVGTDLVAGWGGMGDA